MSLPPVSDLTTAAVEGSSTVLNGYVARPDDVPGPWPGVVVVHEAFGLDEVTCRQADRLADAGYLAVAVDLFSAGGARRCLVPTFRALLSGGGRTYADIETSRQWLLSQDDCTGKVGIIGFCMGGGFALMTVQTGFDAASANYGHLPKNLDEVMGGACPVVGSYGASDWSLKGAAARLEASLARAGVAHDVQEYRGAGHSFMNDAPNGPRLLRPLLRVGGIGPRPQAAADAWSRIESFFGEHLT